MRNCVLIFISSDIRCGRSIAIPIKRYQIPIEIGCRNTCIRPSVNERRIGLKVKVIRTSIKEKRIRVYII